jgi:hypothetical protein
MAPADPLTELRDRVHAAQAAAERLAGEAREWPRREAADELDALVVLLRTLRELVPPELQQQVSDVMRQVLLLLRAIIDFWVERLDSAGGSQRAAVEVQDIPVD